MRNDDALHLAHHFLALVNLDKLAERVVTRASQGRQQIDDLLELPVRLLLPRHLHVDDATSVHRVKHLGFAGAHLSEADKGIVEDLDEAAVHVPKETHLDQLHHCQMEDAGQSLSFDTAATLLQVIQSESDDEVGVNEVLDHLSAEQSNHVELLVIVDLED